MKIIDWMRRLPKSCANDSDCKRKNGILGECHCAVDGNKYCVPSISDPDIVTGMWNLCNENAMWAQSANNMREYQTRMFND
jgi:hypothetical protein